MSNATDLPPAGWYPDSTTPGQERWWNGRSWTDHSRPRGMDHAHRQATAAGVKCPRCGSGDAKTLRVIRQQGISTGMGHASGWVEGNGTDPGHMVTMTTRTTTYTDAALSAAPPRKKQNGITLVVAGPILGILLAWMGWWLGSSNVFGSALVNVGLAAILAIAVMAIGIVLTPGDVAWNRDTFPKLYDRWSRSWSCQRCGEVFTV